MIVVQINTTCGIGSTGKICVGISQILEGKSIENYILYSSKSNGCKYGIRCSDEKYIKLQALRSRIFGNYGFNSKKATIKIIAELERLKPDIVHLHNIHSHDCDLERLFKYFKDKKTKLLWTFHDCWAFTGYCPHFAMMKCDKWKIECSRCVQKREYSWCFDRSRELFNKKKYLFEGLDLTIVTPSKWLADMVKLSFLKEYPVQVINNGIDLAIFKPTESLLREKYGISPEKKIILGVAFDWGPRKGLDVFVALSRLLDREKYQIVLVGTNDEIDKQLPSNILSIHRTQNQAELAQIYTAADVFVNPTREEVLGMTNIEANACGTPVVTFKAGGSPECICSSSGVVVEIDDFNQLKKEIFRICETVPYSIADCRRQAERFDRKERYKEYVDLYEKIDTQ